ncbi:MAG: ATP-binding protein [Limnobacter sp.]|uniref:sensor histidine kinase n=1 Tax=Limnobacter sp. TaxID=2003368 RepID=UPI0022C52AB5|nr:ATP-binding protein [Limnobacter sp.]MCZ8014742.1 ATP-binding protein [Limnobacter sp.]
MLHLILRLLSFVTGQRLLTPEETARQQYDLMDLRTKQLAVENLSGQLRTEMKRQQAQASERLQTEQAEHQLELTALRAEIKSLQVAYSQLDQSVDLETQRQMKENNDLLSQLNWLSGTIAHDFRAPLRAIDAYSFFLADELGDNTPPEASRLLEEIRRNGKRMGVLLDALIEYLRLGVCPLNIQTHDLRETLVQVVNEHFDFSPVPIEIEVQGLWQFDKPLMMRAFKELIDNAVKFSKDQPEARVKIRQASPNHLEIIDNGVGFSDEHQSQKFQLFHRMHGNDEFEGEGIGLATAERIVSRHHMTLTLTRVGNQTVANIQLPERTPRPG